MKSLRSLFLLTMAATVVQADEPAGPPRPEVQIAGALAAAPEDRREEARGLGYDASGELVELRAGSNDLVCLADEPGDERFHVACYHVSLEPYMRRGRELRAAGATGLYGAPWLLALALPVVRRRRARLTRP